MKNSPPLLTTTAYFPPAHWFIGALNAGAWEVEGHENYQKGGYRNRCRIAGPNGPQLLTVPLEKGKHQRKPITEVRISYRTDWWRAHEQSIRTSYGRSPYFEYFAEDLFSVLRSQPETLWELNQGLLATAIRLLQWPVAPTVTKDYILPSDTNYLRLKDMPDELPPYPQVFTERRGFIGGLSVLDTLFCLGRGMVTAG